MNRWNIPASLEREVRERDRSCVYCGTSFAQSTARRDRPSWEHIVNDAALVSRENIALCCVGCNASKGSKVLALWLRSRYCSVRGISEHSVAPVVQAALAALPMQSVGIVDSIVARDPRQSSPESSIGQHSALLSDVGSHPLSQPRSRGSAS